MESPDAAATAKTSSISPGVLRSGRQGEPVVELGGVEIARRGKKELWKELFIPQDACYDSDGAPCFFSELLT